MKKIILVTGSSGFLGSHLQIHSKKIKKYKFKFVNSNDFNLEKLPENIRMIDKIRPFKIIHLAAYSGGIMANKKYPADFYERNLLIINNIFFALKKSHHKIDNILITIGGCSYPSNAKNPISEEEMWNGYPQSESAAYSVAKKTAIVASEAFKTQYNINSQIIIPGNLYGEYDNFSSENSHVIPGIIRRMHKEINSEKFVCWGDGSPIRDFVYAGDVAKIILKIATSSQKRFKLLNISSGKGISIKKLINLIKSKIKYKGTLVWDKTKPNGQKVKIFSTKQMKKLNINCDTKLSSGLSKTIKWYKKKIKLGKVRI